MRTILVPIGVILLGVSGCLGWGASNDREPPRYTAPPPVAAAPNGVAPPNAGWQGGGPMAPQGEAQVAGIPYVELVTGGARSDEQLPMIVAMHPHGGSVDRFVQMFQSFPARARVIIPHGHPTANGNGHYNWWEPTVAHYDPAVVSAAVRPVELQMAQALRELPTRRPTIGRPVICGFSQGGMLSFALVVNHPELVSAAFPMAGFLPVGFSPGVLAQPGPRPYVHAFVGADDPVVKPSMVHGSVDELRRFGVRAEVTEYPGVGHRIGADELQAAMTEMAPPR
jgi:phospholipase/carboxylesterase